MKRTIIFLAIALLISGSLLAAAKVKIDIKDSWKDGETPSFNYEITFSDKMVTFLPHIDCSGNMPVAFLEEQTATTSPFKGTYYGVKIDDKNIEPQECVASVSIISKERIKAEKKFKVIAKPSMDFSLVTCQDDLCKAQKGTFIKDNTVYMTYVSKASPTVTAVVVYPDGRSVNTTVPGSFIANQAGKYIVKISGTKNDFKDLSSTAEIVVIEPEKAVPIPYAPFSVKAGQLPQRPTYETTAAGQAKAEDAGASGSKWGCTLVK